MFKLKYKFIISKKWKIIIQHSILNPIKINLQVFTFSNIQIK